MKTQFDEVEAIAKVTPKALRAYLASRGWRKAEPYGAVGDVYALDDRTPAIIVPGSSAYADYPLRIEQAALTLANAEGRAKNSVLNDLFLADADVVSVRYADDGQDGSMPVDAYLSIVAESRNMLMAAACSAIRPQRDFQNMSKVKMALKYLKSARVAQSGQDGCAIKLMTFTPSEYPDGASGGGEADQFPGKVMNKLASGLATTRQAIDLADLDTDAQSFDSRVDEGMSANLCDAVTGLLGKKDDSVIDVSISWALTGAKSGKRVGVRFDGSDARALRAASKILRGDFQN